MRLSLAVADARARIASIVIAVCAVAAPALAQPAPAPDRHGFTAEANLGVGVLTSSLGISSNVSLAGLDVGAGGWVTPHAALTLRIVEIQPAYSGSSQGAIVAFVGPSLQYWLDMHLWLGGGIGVSLIHAFGNGCTNTSIGSDCQAAGLGFDLRAGYSVPLTRRHAIDVSLEVAPGIYSVPYDTATLVQYALLLGYQFQ